MRQQPVLTLTAVLALATGVFMATTGFTFLEAVLWARIPFEGGDRFVIVEAYTEPAARRAAIEDERFRHLRAGVPALQHVGAFDDSAQNLILSDGEVALVA